MFSDDAIVKCFLCIEYITSGPCKVHDEVGFKIINIVDGLWARERALPSKISQSLTIEPIASTTSYKSAIPLPESPRT